jgi:hypothetical protein
VKEPNLLIKTAAVVSSLLLVGGFVSYRAGAFNGLVGRSAQPTEPAVFQQTPPATTEAAPTMMSSSKSIILGTNHYTVPNAPPATEPAGTPPQAPPATTQPGPTVIIGGTKSAAVFPGTLVPDPAGKPANQPAAANPKKEPSP